MLSRVHQNRFLRRRRRPRRLDADERKLTDRAHAAVLRELERARLRAQDAAWLASAH
jgi:hypothetical protein